MGALKKGREGLRVALFLIIKRFCLLLVNAKHKCVELKRRSPLDHHLGYFFVHVVFLPRSLSIEIFILLAGETPILLAPRETPDRPPAPSVPRVARPRHHFCPLQHGGEQPLPAPARGWCALPSRATRAATAELPFFSPSPPPPLVGQTEGRRPRATSHRTW